MIRNMSMLYELFDLAKIYGEKTVLDIASLKIEAGQILALLGPNGAGKTTLMNILAFLEAPTRGRVHFLSQRVKYTPNVLQHLRKTVVLVDQHPILFTTTVFKNIEFGLKIRGISKQRRSLLIDEALDIVGMRGFAHEPAHRLSGGETQRVALARVLALAPAVFLCDEPTAGVDAENQQIVIDILRRINEEKKINVIFTTHDRNQAASLARHTVVLDKGRLFSATYENFFTGLLEPEDPDHFRLVIRNGFFIKIPSERQGLYPGRVRVFIDPAKIQIFPATAALENAEGFSGNLIGANQEYEKIHLVVDIGVRVSLLLAEDIYRQKRIMVGDRVKIIPAVEAFQIHPV